jgi:hypothetical protein
VKKKIKDFSFYEKFVGGHSSVVERNLAKVDVARSNRVARFKLLCNPVVDFFSQPPSSRGLGQLPFTEQTGIRIPLGVKNN